MGLGRSELITRMEPGMHWHKSLQQLHWLLYGEKTQFPRVLGWSCKLLSNQDTFEMEMGSF